MMADKQQHTQGGTHEQHVKAGQQSHKNVAASTHTAGDTQKSGPASQGGTHEQHVEAGRQSHKNTGSSHASHQMKDTGDDAKHDDMKHDDMKHGKSTPGGTHEQHVEAGKQSHKSK